MAPVRGLFLTELRVRDVLRGLWSGPSGAAPSSPPHHSNLDHRVVVGSEFPENGSLSVFFSLSLTQSPTLTLTHKSDTVELLPSLSVFEAAQK